MWRVNTWFTCFNGQLNLETNDQTGFVKGRFIRENIRLVYDIMNYTQSKEIPGLIMLIDFE